MPAQRKVDLPGLSVTVRELTVAEVRDWAVEIETGSKVIDVAGEFAFDGFSLDDILRMCDAPKAELEKFAPSDLAPLVSACKELNSHFFRAREAVTAAQVAMIRELSRGASNATQ
jgi:hypothetical protein